MNPSLKSEEKNLGFFLREIKGDRLKGDERKKKSRVLTGSPKEQSKLGIARRVMKGVQFNHLNSGLFTRSPWDREGQSKQPPAGTYAVYLLPFFECAGTWKRWGSIVLCVFIY